MKLLSYFGNSGEATFALWSDTFAFGCSGEAT